MTSNKQDRLCFNPPSATDRITLIKMKKDEILIRTGFIPTQTLGISSPTHFSKQEITAECGSSQYQVNYALIQQHLPVDIIGIIPTLQKTPNFSLWRAKAQDV